MARFDLTTAVDTNVLLRLIVEDDEAQAAAARTIFGSSCSISATVLLETGWVLASRFRWNREEIADVLTRVLDMPNVVAESESIGWAIERYRVGGDLADMIHVAVAGTCDRFVTFDAAIAKHVGDDPPVRIEMLT